MASLYLTIFQQRALRIGLRTFFPSLPPLPPGRIPADRLDTLQDRQGNGLFSC